MDLSTGRPQGFISGASKAIATIGEVGTFISTLNTGPTLVAPASTFFIVMGGIRAIEAETQTIIPRAGKIKNLFAIAATNTLSLASAVITVLKDSIATALTVTIPSGSTSLVSDVTNIVSFAAGNRFSVSIATGGLGIGAVANIGVGVEFVFDP